jgi:hypothetical protein
MAGMRPTYVETRWVDVAALRDFPGNPRIHDEERLNRIIAELGQAKSLTVRTQPDEPGAWQILGGHGTRDALVRAGTDKVLVEVWAMDDETAVAVNASLNSGSDGASYNTQLQADMMRRLEAGGMLTAAGFTDDEFDDIIARAQEAAAPLLTGAAAYDAIRVASGADRQLNVGPADVSDLPHLYGDGADGTGDSSGVRSTPSLTEYAARYADKTTRALVLDYPNNQFAWLIEQLAALRGELEVTSNADVLLVLVQAHTGTRVPAEA